jgi:hypothetical protein
MIMAKKMATSRAVEEEAVTIAEETEEEEEEVAEDPIGAVSMIKRERVSRRQVVSEHR